MNEELLAQIINGMRMNQQQGTVGNVSNNEAAMFSGNPMNGAVMAQAANEMRALQEKGAAGNGILSQDEINRFVYLRNMMNPNLPQQESIGMPTDIDGASAGTPMSQDKLNMLLQQLQRMR